MNDIDRELQAQLRRASPQLSLADADELIQATAIDCLDLRDDALAQDDTGYDDFFTFCHLDDVALAAVVRQTEVEFFAFAANESLIPSAQTLAMRDIPKFLQMIRKRFRAPAQGLVLPMENALPWMEQHRQNADEGEGLE